MALSHIHQPLDPNAVEFPLYNNTPFGVLTPCEIHVPDYFSANKPTREYGHPLPIDDAVVATVATLH